MINWDELILSCFTCLAAPCSAVSNIIELGQKVDMFTQWISCPPLAPLQTLCVLIPYFWESDFFSKRLIDEVHWLLALGRDYTQEVIVP